MVAEHDWQLERFVVDACAELDIPVKRLSSLELTMTIPPQHRDFFGNLKTIRMTSSQELRIHDPDLEFLAPGCYAIECLTGLLSRSDAPYTVLVAGVPRRIEPEAYLDAFEERFLAPPDTDEHLPGRLAPGIVISQLDQAVSFRTYVRVMMDLQISGPNPIHERFPILVDLETKLPLQTTTLHGRPLYGVEELGDLATLIPEPLPLDTLAEAVSIAGNSCKGIATRLAGLALGEVTGHIRDEGQRMRDYYRDRIQKAKSREEKELLERQLEQKLENNKARAKASGAS